VKIRQILNEQSYRFSLGTGSIVDLNRGRHAGREDDILRDLIDVDAHRDALGESHPSENGVHGGNPLIVGLCIGNVDRAGDAVDVATHCPIIAYQRDFGRIAHTDWGEVRFLEIAIDPVRFRIDKRDGIYANVQVIAQMRRRRASIAFTS
jgi:hypothetical protein